jgi:surface protein
MPSTTGQVYLGSSLINDLRFDNNSPWNRPASWIAMPTITSTEQKVAALFLVGDNDSNFVAFRFSGNYTVDWGDGNIENVAAGVTAQHNYVFSSLSASTEIGPTGSKMRQAMIVITPQAGQNLTSVSFNFKHSLLGATTYTTPILEIALSAPSCTTLLINGTIGNLRLLEQCTILSHNATNMTNLFQGCASLQSVPLFNTSGVIFMSGMFQGCASLQSVPLFNTTLVTTMTNLFQGCASLQSVPLFNTTAVTTMTSMFQGCTALQSVPLFNTTAVIIMSSMLQSCASLQSVPLFNTTAVTNMANMFNGCRSLQSIPNLNCSSATSISLFALNCNGLKRCQATGIKGSISFESCALSATNLNEIYTNLADLTSLPTQTITVTGNYGIATDNPAIATAKNWTVVG